MSKAESKADVVSILNDELKKKFRFAKWICIAFAAGFAIFIGIGVTWRDNFFRPIIEDIYSPAFIYSKMKSDISKDEDFINKLKQEISKDRDFFKSVINDEEKTKIAENIIKSIGDRVDSGYTKTIIFSEESRPNENFMIFYARSDQKVEATILAKAFGSDAKLRVILDGKTWGEPLELPLTLFNVDITKKLRHDIPPGGNIHMLRFLPEPPKDEFNAVIDSVILVKNAGEK